MLIFLLFFFSKLGVHNAESFGNYIFVYCVHGYFVYSMSKWPGLGKCRNFRKFLLLLQKLKKRNK
jgi:hypothetical protein